MFIQVHTLTSYPAALLNRDDAGLAKRLPFGDATRLRVSSQCLKRHWRDRMAVDLPNVPDGLRTRQLFSREIQPRLVAAGVPDDRATALCEQLLASLIMGGGSGTEMSQPVLFGLREAEFITGLALEAHAGAESTKDAVENLKKRLADREQKKNLKAMSKAAAGLTAAMFGRFVTSDILARVDAPIHVAHSMTVHGADTEIDYFTVVDDLNREDEAGAAHANETELAGGLFYGYVVIDVPLLVSNITGCERAAWRSHTGDATRDVVRTLIRAITEQSPGAKLGSTAPYSRSECVLLECGPSQPRTLANAYSQALKPRGDLMQHAVDAMAGYVARIDGMYGRTASARRLSTIKDAARFEPDLQPVSLDDAIAQLLREAFDVL